MQGRRRPDSFLELFHNPYPGLSLEGSFLSLWMAVIHVSILVAWIFTLRLITAFIQSPCKKLFSMMWYVNLIFVELWNENYSQPVENILWPHFISETRLELIAAYTNKLVPNINWLFACFARFILIWCHKCLMAINQKSGYWFTHLTLVICFGISTSTHLYPISVMRT